MNVPLIDEATDLTGENVLFTLASLKKKNRTNERQNIPLAADVPY